MDPDGFNLPPRKTLWMYFREELRRAHLNRPMSFYLLLTIPVALFLGAGVLKSQDNPKWLAFYLSLFFLFFLAVLVGAVVDFFDIFRRHFFEHHKVFRSTLGDAEFVTRLGEGVERQRGK